jgi:hypothetical protein
MFRQVKHIGLHRCGEPGAAAPTPVSANEQAPTHTLKATSQLVLVDAVVDVDQGKDKVSFVLEGEVGRAGIKHNKADNLEDEAMTPDFVIANLRQFSWWVNLSLQAQLPKLGRARTSGQSTRQSTVRSERG